MPGMMVLTVIVGGGSLLLILWLLRRLRASVTRVEPGYRSVLHTRDCPVCKAAMTSGYCVAGRGLIWRDIQDPPPGQFLPLWKVLPNTISAGLRVLENRAWRCVACQLILLDHSAMVDRHQLVAK